MTHATETPITEAFAESCVTYQVLLAKKRKVPPEKANILEIEFVKALDVARDLELRLAAAEAENAELRRIIDKGRSSTSTELLLSEQLSDVRAGAIKLMKRADAAESRAEALEQRVHELESKNIEDYSLLLNIAQQFGAKDGDDMREVIYAGLARAEASAKDAGRYLDAIFQMADDGWLIHGVEGMDDTQKVVYEIAQEHPEYKRRCAIDAAKEQKRG